MAGWTPFPYSTEDFEYSDARLKAAWAKLHRGDRVAFPDVRWVQDCIEKAPGAAPSGYDGDLKALASTIQQAWQAFHAGEFGTAVEISGHAGLLAHACANKATGIYASRLEPRVATQQALFQKAIDRAESAIALLPEDPNSYYFQAFNLGRLGQSISVTEALRKGMGGKIHNRLIRTLELAPDHAEAHSAMGMYHAEVINKVGKLIGGMTYGVSADKAVTHFETALELTPDSPIAHIEYGNGLYLLFGDRKLDQVTDLYIKASELKPRDAMEKLDVEVALAELE